LILEKIKFKLNYFLGILFQRDFYRVIKASEDGLSEADVNWTSSSDSKTLLKILEKIRKLKQENSIFCDIGCGTGYVLFKYNRSFLKCIGIEINSISFKIAKKNLKNFNNVNLYNINALDFDFSEVDFLFLYNPFPEHIMLSFLEKIKHIERRMYLIYLNPVYYKLIELNGWFLIDEINCRSNCYIYTNKIQ